MTPTFETPISGGLVVVGTHPHCGKTAIVCGLTLALSGMGQRVLPIAPIELDAAPDKHITGHYVISHLCRQSGTPPTDFNPILLPSAGQLSKNQWHHLMSQLGQQPYPTIVDTPYSVALPWSFQAPKEDPLGDGFGYSAVGLAHALGWPILVVTPYSGSVIANVWPTLQWLSTLPVTVAGWVAVERTPLSLADEETWNKANAWLHCESTVPFLGCLSHAPQLSIPMGHTGDLVQKIEDGLDLLPIQLALGL